MTTNRTIAAASLTIATLIFPAFAMADRRPAPAPAPRHAAPAPSHDRRDDGRRDNDRRDNRRDSDRGRVGLSIGLSLGAIFAPRPAGHYETVYEQVLVSPAHYEIQNQQVMVAPAHYETSYVAGGYEVVYDSFGNPHTVAVPARTEQVLVPAQYETRQVQVLVPAVYQTQAVNRWVGY